MLGHSTTVVTCPQEVTSLLGGCRQQATGAVDRHIAVGSEQGTHNGTATERIASHAAGHWAHQLVIGERPRKCSSVPAPQRCGSRDAQQTDAWRQDVAVRGRGAIAAAATAARHMALCALSDVTIPAQHWITVHGILMWKGGTPYISRSTMYTAFERSSQQTSCTCCITRVLKGVLPLEVWELLPERCRKPLRASSGKPKLAIACTHNIFFGFFLFQDRVSDSSFHMAPLSPQSGMWTGFKL
jgi:hypothetical protein